MSRFHWRAKTGYSEEYECYRIGSEELRGNLRAQMIAARRWHSGAVAEIDHVWRRGIERIDSLPLEMHEAAWERLARDLEPYFAGVPGESD